MSNTWLMGVYALACTPLFLGCAHEDNESLDGASVDCGLSDKGLGYQGLGYQGLGYQGLGYQGLGYQGLGYQGLGLQGLGYQGLGYQGLGYQGLGYQGLGYQGLGYQGLGYQGLGYQGLGYQGLWSNGLEQDGSRPAVDLSDLDLVASLTLDKGMLVGTTASGRALEGDTLRGLKLPFLGTQNQTVWVEIAEVEVVQAGALAKYSLQIDGENVCANGEAGVFVSGVWDETGQRLDSVNVQGRNIDTSFSCSDGVIAKCTLWGYNQWSAGIDTHQTCTRMARADYCGDGVGHTENGTLIDMFDVRGIQTTTNSPELSFEAGWGPNGAVCVSEPRYVDVTPNGQQLLPSCWNQKPTCSNFEAAVELGAELGNDSAHQLRELSCN